MTAVFNVADPAFVSDPYPAYARLRDTDPVHRLTLPDGTKAWLLTRYDDVRSAYADPRLKMNRSYSTDWQGLSLPPALAVTLANTDPPVHTRLRRLLSAAFTPRHIDSLAPKIRRLADELLVPVLASGSCDLVAAFARPLPIKVFRELFGIPEEDDDEIFLLVGKLFVPNSDDRAHLKEVAVRMSAYLGELIRRKQREPGDDLLSALIKAKDVEGRLTEDELTAMTAVLMVAGSETTSHLITNTVITLFRHPDVRALVTRDPETLPSVLDEVLRYEGPVPSGVRRFATEDIEIAGVTIAKGDAVIFSLAAANRDPAVFAEPGRFDQLRADSTRHMAFGHGIHYCVGARLAKLEARIAISILLRRLPGLTPAVPVEQLHWRDNMNIRGVRELPVTWKN